MKKSSLLFFLTILINVVYAQSFMGIKYNTEPTTIFPGPNQFLLIGLDCTPERIIQSYGYMPTIKNDSIMILESKNGEKAIYQIKDNTIYETCFIFPKEENADNFCDLYMDDWIIESPNSWFTVVTPTVVSGKATLAKRIYHRKYKHVIYFGHDEKIFNY